MDRPLALVSAAGAALPLAAPLVAPTEVPSWLPIVVAAATPVVTYAAGLVVRASLYAIGSGVRAKAAGFTLGESFAIAATAAADALDNRRPREAEKAALPLPARDSDESPPHP